MLDNDIPSKTQEGLAEIKTRAMGLAPRMRTALLLVDGVKPVRELEQLLTASGVKPGALQTLLDKGLIAITQKAPDSIQPIATPPQEPAPREAEAAPEPAPVVEAVAAPTPVAPAPAAPLPEPVAPVKAVAVPKPPPVAPAPTPAPKPAPVAKAAPAPKSSPKAASNTIAAVKAAPAPKAISKTPAAPKATPPRQRPATRAVAPAAPVVPAPVEQKKEEVRPAPVHNPAAPPEDMKLVVARAHVASALDDRLDNYMLRQMIASCSSRAQLESMFDVAEKALKETLGGTRSAHVLDVAKALLHS